MNEEDVNALNEDDSFLKLMQDSGLTVSLTVRYKNTPWNYNGTNFDKVCFIFALLEEYRKLAL